MTATTDNDRVGFEAEKQFHEKLYLAGTNPRQQSGFGRDDQDWERFRRPVVAPIRKSGTFLDIGCASGLLMEDVTRWAGADGYSIEPYGLEISEKLADLVRRRLPQWRDRIYIGNALHWDPPMRFDYARTELVYVPSHRRQAYAERLLSHVVVPGGMVIFCSYGSSRPEGKRAEPLLDEFSRWGLEVARVHDVVSQDHGFVITRAVAVSAQQ